MWSMLIDHASRRYLGSSDIGPVLALYRPEMLSLAKYQNSTDVWLRVAHGIKQPPSPRMDRGLREEPRLRELYRSTIGECSEAPPLQIHPAHEWACGSPDSMLGDDGILELKTTIKWTRNKWGEPGTDQVPDMHNIQTQWQLECSRRSWCRLLVAFGEDMQSACLQCARCLDGDLKNCPTSEPYFHISETAVYQMRRDPRLCAALVEVGERFWRTHVLGRESPEMKPRHNIREWARIQNERRDDSGNPEAERGAGEGAGQDDAREQG